MQLYHAVCMARMASQFENCLVTPFEVRCGLSRRNLACVWASGVGKAI